MYGTIDIGGTKTRFAVIDETRNIVNSTKIATPSKYSDLLTEIAKYFMSTHLQAMGVGTAGNVNIPSGSTENFGPSIDWGKQSLAQDIADLLGVVTRVDNDTNCGALGEALYGAGVDYRSVLYVTISTNIGTGFVFDKKILEATANAEGGKVLLADPDGKICKLEDMVSGSLIVEKYKQMAKDITDPAIWQQISTPLALGLQASVTILNPEVVVFGGSVGAQFDRFADHISDFFNNHPFNTLPTPVFAKAFNPDECVLLGAYELARTAHKGEKIWN